MLKEKLTKYWKLRRKYNTLLNDYEVLEKEIGYKNRFISRLKNENKKLKEEKKRWLQPKKKRKKHITSVKEMKKI